MTRSCVHHWKLDSPGGGPEVQGVCRKCDEERMFPVSIWDGEMSKMAQERRDRGRSRGHATNRKKGATA